MIKKCSFLLLAIIFLSSINTSTVFAASESTITYLEDGYYLITENADNFNTPIAPLASSIVTKNGYKPSRLYDAQDRLLLTFTVYASFTINTGVSVKCTQVTYGKTISSDNWTFVSATTSKNNSSTSKASATATGVFRNVNTGKKVTIPVTVYCTKDGTIS